MDRVGFEPTTSASFITILKRVRSERDNYDMLGEQVYEAKGQITGPRMRDASSLLLLT